MTAVAYGIAFPAARGVLTPTPKPLLDRLSATPVAAYATWLLRSTYAGACLRVRRSSDNAEQDIGFASIAGRPIDASALVSFAGAGDAFVTKYYSQATTPSRDIAQATVASQPKIVSAGALTLAPNGTPGMVFDGVNDTLRATFTLNQPVTHIGAARIISWASVARLWDGAGALAATFMYSDSPNIQIDAGNVAASTSTAMSIGNDHVVTDQINGDFSKLAVDTGSYATGSIGATNPGGFTVGGDAFTGNHGNIAFYGGVIFDAIASDADIALCRTALGGPIGLSL